MTWPWIGGHTQSWEVIVLNNKSLVSFICISILFYFNIPKMASYALKSHIDVWLVGRYLAHSYCSKQTG